MSPSCRSGSSHCAAAAFASLHAYPLLCAVASFCSIMATTFYGHSEHQQNIFARQLDIESYSFAAALRALRDDDRV